MTKNIVLYIDAMIMPDKNAAAQRATAICRSLIDIGKTPIVIGLDNEITSKDTILKTQKEYDNIKCYSVKYPKTIPEWLCRMTTIKPFIEVMKVYGIENIHSIIAMDYEVIALYRLKKLCKRNDIKLVADSVEWYGKSSLPFPMNIVKNIDTKLRMEYFYPKLEYMICISSFLKKHFEKKVTNIVEIPGTINRNNPKWKQVNEYEGNNIFTIGYAGNPGLKFDKERIDWLIEAVIELNKESLACKLVLAGFNESIIKNQRPDLYNNINYKLNIKHMGTISHVECLNMIALCDFSVIIRDDNRVTRAGFPTKFSESFGCGTPVITTPTSNVADYIIEGETGILCCDFSMKSVKESIVKAMNISKKTLFEIHKSLKINKILDYSVFTLVLKDLLEK